MRTSELCMSQARMMHSKLAKILLGRIFYGNSGYSHYKELYEANQSDTTEIDLEVSLLKAKLLNGVADPDKVIAIRFVECVVALTNLCKYYHSQLKEILDLIFEHFFNEDILVKVTLIDFIIDICDSKWNAEYMIENGFISKILAGAIQEGDVYGLINHRFIVAIACVHSKFPHEFSLSDDYFHFLRSNIESKMSEDRDSVLNALFFLLQNKKNLEILTSNDEFIRDWLTTSSFINEDLRKSFFTSLRSLLSMPEDAEKYADLNETIFKIFSNIKTPHNYPNNGDIKDSVAYVLKYVMSPVESEDAKITHYHLISELIQWHWGFKEVFKNGDFVKFLLNRRKEQPKAVLEAKYDFVTKAVQSLFIAEDMHSIDSTVTEQLKNYYKNGIYGKAGSDYQEFGEPEFQVATEGTG